MMRFIIFLTGMAVLTASITGCGGDQPASGNDAKPGGDSAATSTPSDGSQFEKNGLKVYPVTGSPEYPDAKIELTSPPPGVDLAEGKNKLTFNLTNFELGPQTADAATKGIANSKDGQHIHLLLNNSPYMAHYKPELEEDMKAGHYVLLAFLSRSYHESVKSPNAFTVRQFVVGQPETYKEADLKAPHMFYSRPKGAYKPGDYDKLLLDFFLINCELSADGYKVRATINGADFMLTKWVPYIIEGLKAGEATIKLELLDKEGNLVPSPFNPVERKVTLEANA